MTALLGKVFKVVEELPESEQNTFAQWVLELIEDEHRWDSQFAASIEQTEKIPKL